MRKQHGRRPAEDLMGRVRPQRPQEKWEMSLWFGKMALLVECGGMQPAESDDLVMVLAGWDGM